MTNDFEKIRITKLEAAKRQLDCAIELWFRGGDEISMHTLASAAYEIIHDIHIKKGIDVELLYNTARIKDEFHEEWTQLLRKPANFMKHANRDPDGVLELDAKDTLVFILHSIRGLKSLGDQGGVYADALGMWLALNNPSWINPKYRKIIEDSLPPEDLAHFRQIKLTEFLDAFLLARRHGDSR